MVLKINRAFAVLREEKSETIVFTSFLSLLIHLILIVGIGFSFPEPQKMKQVDPLLAFHQAKEEPFTADYKAAKAQDSSGSEEENRQARILHSPLVVSLDFLPQSELVVSSKERDEEPAVVDDIAAKKDDLLARSEKKISEGGALGADANSPQLRTAREAVQAKILNVEASLGALEEARAKKPRIKRYTSVAAQSAVEAEYIYRWVRKIEEVGTLNYPPQAVEEKLDGSLRLLVAVNTQGHLVELKVLHGSGYRVLDDAARYIVRLAEPFEPFPPALEEQADIIEIVRRWQFLSAGRRLVTE